MDSSTAAARVIRAWPILILVILTLLGGYARFVNAGAASSLWLDEAWRIESLLEADSLLKQIMAPPNAIDPPLFSLLIYGLAALYNVELVLRLAAVIPGILSIPLAFLIARRLFPGRGAALLAAFLTAFSPDLTAFSKELKPYSLCFCVHLAVLLGYLACRRRMTSRATLWFTISLIPAILFSMNIVFALPGIFLALLFRAARKEHRRIMGPVLVAGFVVSLFCVAWFVWVIPDVSGTGELGFLTSYWSDYFCPHNSTADSAVWFLDAYLRHFESLSFAGRLAPGIVASNLKTFYPAMAFLGFVILFFRRWRRGLEYLSLFLMPMVVMAVFNLFELWPFGPVRMNLFVFAYILFPPLFLLGGTGPSRVDDPKAKPADGSTVLSYICGVTVCLLMLLQFPVDFTRFAERRITWEHGAGALTHLLDAYSEGPPLPLLVNSHGISQFTYYSRHHEHLSKRYRRQSHLFRPVVLAERKSRFYTEGIALRTCLENRNAAVLLAHHDPEDTRTYQNPFSIEYDGFLGNRVFSCFITSFIAGAEDEILTFLPTATYSGHSKEWIPLFRSPLLPVSGADKETILVFTFDLIFRNRQKDFRVQIFDEHDSTLPFDTASFENTWPLIPERFEGGVATRLEEPVEQVRVILSARRYYDLTIENLGYFTAAESVVGLPADDFEVIDRESDRHEVENRILGKYNFWPETEDRRIWTRGDAVIELDPLQVDPTAQVLQIETEGWMPTSVRENILGLDPKVYLNGDRRAPLIEVVGEKTLKLRFALPGDVRSVRSVRIISDTFVPREIGVGTDRRALGIDVKSLSFPKYR